MLVSMTFSGIEGGLRVMDHTHICWTRVSTNHLESQIDFLPFDDFDEAEHKNSLAKDHRSVLSCDQCLVRLLRAICRGRCHLNCGKSLFDKKKFQTVLSVNYGPPQSFCVITNKSIFSSFRMFGCLLCL